MRLARKLERKLSVSSAFWCHSWCFMHSVQGRGLHGVLAL